MRGLFLLSRALRTVRGGTIVQGSSTSEASVSPSRFFSPLLLIALSCADTAAPASKLPAQPDGVLATAGTSRITISWRDVGANEKKYVVEVNSGGGLWLPLSETAANTTQAVHTDVEHGVVYRYR